MGSVVNGNIPAMMKATSNGVFDGERPLDFSLPLLILQICLVVSITRSLAFLLRPMRQPRVVAEIIVSFLTNRFTSILFLFLVGLEIDLKSLLHTGKKAISIAAAGMVLPFAMGVATSFAFPEVSSSGGNKRVISFVIFMGVALSITAFGVLARILAELKLLTTDLGRISISAAAINDVSAWILLALAVTLSGNRNSPLIPLWVLLSGIGFVVACFQIFKIMNLWPKILK